MRMLVEESDGLVYFGEQGEEGLTMDREGGRAQLVLQLLVFLKTIESYRYYKWRLLARLDLNPGGCNHRHRDKTKDRDSTPSTASGCLCQHGEDGWEKRQELQNGIDCFRAPKSTNCVVGIRQREHMLGFSISFYLYRMRQIPVLISRARL
jgi:hypothetical protein